MQFKIKTSKNTMTVFEEMAASEHLQPFILAKLSIAESLKSNEPLTKEDFKTDNNGLELNRQTITGEYDVLFKALITKFENRHLDDDEYFVKYLKAHLDRGARLIYAEFRYGKTFILDLLADEKGI